MPGMSAADKHSSFVACPVRFVASGRSCKQQRRARKCFIKSLYQSINLLIMLVGIVISAVTLISTKRDNYQIRLVMFCYYAGLRQQRIVLLFKRICAYLLHCSGIKILIASFTVNSKIFVNY